MVRSGTSQISKSARGEETGKPMSPAELFGNDPGISGWIKRWQIERHWPPNNQAVQYPNKPACNTIAPVRSISDISCSYASDQPARHACAIVAHKATACGQA